MSASELVFERTLEPDRPCFFRVDLEGILATKMTTYHTANMRPHFIQRAFNYVLRRCSRFIEATGMMAIAISGLMLYKGVDVFSTRMLIIIMLIGLLIALSSFLLQRKVNRFEQFKDMTPDPQFPFMVLRIEKAEVTTDFEG